MTFTFTSMAAGNGTCGQIMSQKRNKSSLQALRSTLIPIFVENNYFAK